jgi:hypothetical protein
MEQKPENAASTPTWARLSREDAQARYRPAFAGWAHADGKAEFFKIWIPCDCQKARCGQWAYRLVIRGENASGDFRADKENRVKVATAVYARMRVLVAKRDAKAGGGQ